MTLRTIYNDRLVDGEILDALPAAPTPAEAGKILKVNTGGTAIEYGTGGGGGGTRTFTAVVGFADADYTCDGTDDDVQIQAAIDDVAAAGGGTVFFQTGDYWIRANTNPIVCKTGVSLNFAEGAVFNTYSDSTAIYQVLSLTDVSGINIINPQIIGDRLIHSGTTGEHGMCIQMKGCTDISIVGGYCNYGWGDGIYIGSSLLQAYCKNIRVSGTRCDHNGRNGISIISGINIDIDAECSYNDRTSPKAGIDIEPNYNTEVLKNITVRAKTSNNGNFGIAVGIDKLNGSTESVSINITDHQSYQDFNAFYGYCAGACSGTVIVQNANYSYSEQGTILVRNWWYNAPRLQFNSPSIANPNTGGGTNVYYKSAISIFRYDTDAPTEKIGNVHIVNPSLYSDGTNKPDFVFVCKDYATSPLGVKNVSFIDPICMISVANTQRGLAVIEPTNLEDFTITDRYEKMVGNTDESWHMPGELLSIIDTTNISTARSITMYSSGSGYGEIIVRHNNANFFTIYPPVGEKIIGMNSNNGTRIRTKVPGSSVRLRKITSDTWFADNITGIWEDENTGKFEVDLGDESHIHIKDATNGFGWCQIGDNQEFAHFSWTIDGTVTLIHNSANVVTTDTDNKLCIIDNGTGVIMKNRLGSELPFRYVLNYF